MMLIDQYFKETSVNNRHTVSFTREQSSAFAKDVANDFNPLHDINGKRFCVPGDLLFALVLARYGISKRMRITFSGMVTDTVKLILPAGTGDSPIVIDGENHKHYLSLENTGEKSRDVTLINNLTKSYVTFSGQTFPHVLIPLMQQQQVMINPDRPIVMYESMLIDLDWMDRREIRLELDPAKTHLQVKGKRGTVCLAFNLHAGGRRIGRGEKHMLVSGLRPFEQAGIDRIVANYNDCKQQYQSQHPAPAIACGGAVLTTSPA